MAGHDHGIDRDSGDGRIWLAIIVNIVLTVVQVIGGIVAGSLALIADALHNLSDGLALVIAFIARRIARRREDATMTFGYARAETVAALVNYTTLIIIGIYLAFEAVMRLFNPEPVDGWIVVWVALAALVIDFATAALTYTMSKTSMNIRAAFLHNVADALGSLGVIVAGVIIILYDWRLIDPLITLLISGYILWLSIKEIRGVIRILMLGSPPGESTEAVIDAVGDVEGVRGVHRARYWQVTEHDAAFDAHIIVDEGAWSRADAIKADVKAMLMERFDIHESTLELECAIHGQDDAPPIGRARQ
ncbi:MAG: cation diffusion facilitator family transporter [Devosia sp.]